MCRYLREVKEEEKKEENNYLYLSLLNQSINQYIYFVIEPYY